MLNFSVLLFAALTEFTSLTFKEIKSEDTSIKLAKSFHKLLVTGYYDQVTISICNQEEETMNNHYYDELHKPQVGGAGHCAVHAENKRLYMYLSMQQRHCWSSGMGRLG